MLGKITYHKPINMVVFVNIIAYAFLIFKDKPYQWHALLMYCVVVTMICTVYCVIIKKKLGEGYLFLIVSMLLSIGIMMIYRLNPDRGYKQVVWSLIGIFVFFTSYYLYQKSNKWHKYTYFYIAISVILYLITFVFGTTINGARNWIVIGSYSFQPSELNKIIFIFFLACYFKNPDKLFIQKFHYDENVKIIVNRVLLMFVTYINIGFLVFQREWGITALFLLIYLVVLYVYGKGKYFFVINLALILPVAIIGYKFFYHIRVRVETWIDPWSDILGKGYQITQSLFAIGSGGFFGTGLGMGKPYLIPEVSTDFIFSAICEEMGILTGAAIVLLYMLLFYRGIKIVLSIRSKFERIVALGITVMIGIQTFIIIGGVIKLIPLTGITLPFVSYGGSSLVTNFITLGILQAISNCDFSSEGEFNG
ncbi:UNVERIFIED_CONTAM: cell division protein FtsW (lipid II flippase) [Acetivibrio alkalicellulosi]